MKFNNSLASFSARGAEVELAAPGQRIASTFLDGAYAYGSGTSQAVAFAAGIAALVRDTKMDLTAAAVRDLLTATAKDRGETGRDAGFGHGLVDAKAAVSAAANAKKT